MNINEIYEKEKIINSHFKKKYNYNSEDIFNKQVLELLCELSEFAYETKCFKYWKKDKPSSAEITIHEFADCLMITLCFCDLSGIDTLELVDIKEANIIELFIEANRIASSLTIDLDKTKLIKLLSILIKISKLLKYTDEELNKYCTEKFTSTLNMIKEKND